RGGQGRNRACWAVFRAGDDGARQNREQQQGGDVSSERNGAGPAGPGTVLLVVPIDEEARFIRLVYGRMDGDFHSVSRACETTRECSSILSRIASAAPSVCEAD